MKVDDAKLMEESEAVSDWLTKKFGGMEAHFVFIVAGRSSSDNDAVITVMTSNTNSKDLIERLLDLSLSALKHKDYKEKNVTVLTDA